MKQFSFRLKPALKWRLAQMKSEELRLQTLLHDQTVLQRQLLALQADYRRAEDSARTDDSCGGDTLAALSRYRLACMKSSTELTLRLSHLAAGIEKQQSNLLVARRDYELLVKLEERERRQWEIELNRLVEAESSEAFLLRWNRR